ncbi:RrF2 family transcriptional regulator [Ruegeria atlantica]|uniref:RrF2 family transcriptional regulator n=1 Tax=Ruegeria atlantica TaxID=81569 RepID=UPI001C2BE820|nr:Rrf2 family transcriptional regulator [Ruegeria atlantica]
MWLSRLKERRPTIKIAAAYQISHDHLAKVAYRLRKTGLLEAARGRGGGIRLSRSASQIIIGDIIRATEEDMALVECLGQTRTCRIAGVCRFRELFRKALEAYFEVLDAMTLEDAVQFPEALKGALNINRPAIPH